MRRKATAKKLKDWEVFHLGRAGKRLGIVKAADAKAALQRAVEEFGMPAIGHHVGLVDLEAGLAERHQRGRHN